MLTVFEIMKLPDDENFFVRRLYQGRRLYLVLPKFFLNIETICWLLNDFNGVKGLGAKAWRDLYIISTDFIVKYTLYIDVRPKAVGLQLCDAQGNLLEQCFALAELRPIDGIWMNRQIFMRNFTHLDIPATSLQSMAKMAVGTTTVGFRYEGVYIGLGAKFMICKLIGIVTSEIFWSNINYQLLGYIHHQAWHCLLLWKRHLQFVREQMLPVPAVTNQTSRIWECYRLTRNLIVDSCEKATYRRVSYDEMLLIIERERIPLKFILGNESSQLLHSCITEILFRQLAHYFDEGSKRLKTIEVLTIITEERTTTRYRIHRKKTNAFTPVCVMLERYESELSDFFRNKFLSWS